jgi:hypothetical protein
MSKHIASSLEDVRAILHHQLALLWSHPERVRSIAPLMLWGPPGIGKSAVVREVCTTQGIQFVDVRLAQREPIDLRGLPVPNREGNGVDWLVSSEWPRDPESRGIILFDELTAADRTLQVAAYELLFDRRLGTLYEIPPGWLLVAAGNRASDRAVASTMSSALANRFCHLEVLPDVGEWMLWARASGVHPDVLGLLSVTPELFFSMENVDVQRGWPSPRSWERVGLVLDGVEALPERAVQRMIEGLVGPAAAVALTSFRASIGELPNIPALLDGEQPIQLPTRSDLRCAWISSIAFHMWRRPRRDHVLRRLFEIVETLEDDFATLLIHEILRGRSKSEVRAVLLHPSYVRLQERLGVKLRGRLTQASDAMIRDVLQGVDA